MSRIGVSLGMSGILLAARSAKNAYRCAADCGPVTSSMNSFCSTFRPSSNGRLAAASMHWMLYSGARKPRVLRSIDRRNVGEQFGVALGRRHLVVAVAHPFERQAVGDGAGGERDGGAAQRGDVAVGDVVDQAVLQGLGAADVTSRRHHLERHRHTDEARESLRAPGARQETQVDLRAGRTSPTPTPLGSARTVPLRGRHRAPCREWRRSPGPAHPPSPPAPAATTGPCDAPPNSLMSAPAMNVRPSQITTIAEAPFGDGLGQPVQQPLADVPAQRVDRRIVDDDERDVALGVEADGFSQVGHAASQAADVRTSTNRGAVGRPGSAIQAPVSVTRRCRCRCRPGRRGRPRRCCRRRRSPTPPGRSRRRWRPARER